jgi:hypothetical protein
VARSLFPFSCHSEDTSVGTIWTPSGEYRPRDDEPSDATGPSPAPAGASGSPPAAEREQFGDTITPEELAAIRDLHQQLRATPAIDVVANHVIQLFQLATVYLGLGTPPDESGAQPAPDLAQAGVVVDAMACLVDGLGERFGEHEHTLRDALSQLQLAYVQLADRSDA